MYLAPEDYLWMDPENPVTYSVSAGTATNGTLKDTKIEFSTGSACCVIMASNGYPQKYQSGFELSIPADIAKNVYVAGAKLDNNVLKTAGGRVLGATATADTLPEAITAAYKLVDKIHFDNAYYRHDIGARAMRALKED